MVVVVLESLGLVFDPEVVVWELPPVLVDWGELVVVPVDWFELVVVVVGCGGVLPEVVWVELGCPDAPPLGGGDPLGAWLPVCVWPEPELTSQGLDGRW